MPARYEAIRDSYVKRGVPLAKAKQLAAMTYNKTRKPGEEKLAHAVKAERATR